MDGGDARRGARREAFNMDLSQRRANSVLKHLVGNVFKALMLPADASVIAR